MKVEVNCACTETIDISEEEAFRILCRTLYMDCVLDDISEFFIKRDEYGCLGVYKKIGGRYVYCDERGDLFIALRNVAAQLFPNVSFRSAEYIYDNESRFS